MTTALLPSTFQLGDIVLNARDADGVEWIVTRDDDWWAGPDRRVTHIDHPFGDGAGRTRSFAGVRKVTLEGCVIAPSRELRDQRLADLAAIWGDGQLHPLIGPGPIGNDQLMVEYAGAPDISIINSVAAAWQVVLLAPDPLKLSAEAHSVQIGLPSSSGGLTFPVMFPIQFDAVVTSGTAQLTNAGSATTGLQLRIDGGEAVNPSITLARGTDIQTLRTSLTVENGQWLTIDTKAHTVMLNDVVSRRGLVAGTFPLLAPGTSELSWACDVFDPNLRLTATWHDARY